MGNSNGRAAFKGTLDRLLTETISYEDEEFWKSLLTSPLSASDVFELINPDDVRKLRSEEPLNACTLLKRIIVTLREVIQEGSTGMLAASSSNTASTCIRILTRIMPFLLEKPENEFPHLVFWSPGGYIPRVQREFKTQLSNDKLASEEIQASQTGAEEPIENDGMIIGVQILSCIQRLLFLNNFCCKVPGAVLADSENVQKNNVDTRFLWKGGIGSAADLNPAQNSTIIRNRCEVLRCLLCCLSGSLFQSFDDYQKTPPIWIQAYTHGNLPYTANTFCSLISVLFSYDPVGYGLPYGSVFSSADEEELVNVCSQILCILFDFNPNIFEKTKNVQQDTVPAHHEQISQTQVDPNAPYPHNNNSSANFSRGSTGEMVSGTMSFESPGQRGSPDNESSSVRSRNVFKEMLQKIYKTADIDFIFEGIVRLLNTLPSSKSKFLPSSSQAVGYHQEILIILWYLITTNQTFFRRATSTLNSNRLLTPILFLLLESSTSKSESSGGSSKIGSLHMCSFLLLVLSSEREFGVKLNDPFTQKFPLDIPHFTGTHADLLVIITHRVVMDSSSSRTNDSLIDMLLTMMSNISAYIKSFCLESCVRLLSLLDRFSRPSWLFKMPYHYHDVCFLLDLLNNSIQYQYEGNKQLIYSILRQKDLFLNLQNLQFPSKYLEEEDAATADSPDSPEQDDEANKQINDQNDTSKAKNKAPSKIFRTGSKRSDINKSGSDIDLEDQWKPSQQWFSDWKSKLPIQTTVRLIKCLLPKVEHECQEKGLVDQNEVMDFLNKTTMVGLLPVPHPIIIRNYHPNAYTALWFTSYMWGVIFSRSQTFALFDWRQIRLIVINPAAQE